MDTQADYAPFRMLMDQICSVWDRPPAKDEQVKSYWHALRDVRFSEVRSNAERIMRTATGKAPFPKPADLRNEALHESGPSGDARLREADARAIRNLEELRHKDEAAWRKEVAMRRLDRILATEPMGSPIYAQALTEWHRARQYEMAPVQTK